MKHRNRNMLAAVLAAGLLVLSALGSTALAHGGPGGGPGGFGHNPGTTPKAHPSGDPTQKVKPTHLPVTLDCNKPPVSPVPNSLKTGAGPGGDKRDGRSGGWFGFAALKIAADKNRSNNDKTPPATACSLAALMTQADKKIAAQITSLNNVIVHVGKIVGLSAGDRAVLTGEINGLIGDLNALKVKIDAETTVAGIQADLVTLSKDSRYARSISSQVRLIGVAEDVIAKNAKLDALAITLAGQIAAAPAGIDTAAAQKYLTDMKAKLAASEALVAPLPAALLALTPAQLQAGKGDPTMAKIQFDVWQASFDSWKASFDSRVIGWILAGKPDSDDHHDKSPAPSKTPAPSVAPAPTASPV